MKLRYFPNFFAVLRYLSNFLAVMRCLAIPNVPLLYELYDSRLVISSKFQSPALQGYSLNIFGRFSCKYLMAYKGNLTNRGLNLLVKIFIFIFQVSVAHSHFDFWLNSINRCY